MSKICPECRRSNAAEDLVCSVCGAALSAGQQVAATVAVAAPQAAPPGDEPKLAADQPDSADSGDSAERPLWAGRASYKSMIGRWVLWAVAAVVVLVLYLMVPKGSGGWLIAGVRTLAVLAVLLPAVWLLIQTFYVRWMTGYRLTTERLFIDRGLLTRVTDQTELIRIDDVRVRQGLVQRMLGLGDVIVMSQDMTDRQLVMRGIVDPNKVAEHVRTHTRRLRRKKGLYVESL